MLIDANLSSNCQLGLPNELSKKLMFR